MPMDRILLNLVELEFGTLVFFSKRENRSIRRKTSEQGSESTTNSTDTEYGVDAGI